MSSMILNIETSTDICSIALANEGKLISIRESKEQYSHAETITQLTEGVLLEAGISLSELDAVAVSKGPGSYTALRVGNSTAKGFCYALDIPLIQLSSLETLAWAAHQVLGERAIYCAMIDARRMEVYTASYDESNNIITEPSAQIIDEHSFKEIFESGQRIVFCGNGTQKCQSTITDDLASFLEIDSSAKNMISLSYLHYKNQTFSDLVSATPDYIKAPNITVSKRRL